MNVVKAGPVAQSVERWTPYSGSIRPGYESPGSKRDGRSIFMEPPGGHDYGWWQVAASRCQSRGPAVRGYVRTLNFRL